MSIHDSYDGHSRPELLTDHLVSSEPIIFAQDNTLAIVCRSKLIIREEIPEHAVRQTLRLPEITYSPNHSMFRRSSLANLTPGTTDWRDPKFLDAQTERGAVFVKHNGLIDDSLAIRFRKAKWGPKLGDSGPLLSVLTSNHGLNVFELCRGSVPSLLLRCSLMPKWLLELNQMYGVALKELDQSESKANIISGEVAELSRQIDTFDWSASFSLTDEIEHGNISRNHELVSLIAIGHAGGYVSLWVVKGHASASILDSIKGKNEDLQRDAELTSNFVFAGMLSTPYLKTLEQGLHPDETLPKNIFLLPPPSNNEVPAETSIMSIAMTPSGFGNGIVHCALSLSDGTNASIVLQISNLKEPKIKVLSTPVLEFATGTVFNTLRFVKLCHRPTKLIDAVLHEPTQNEEKSTLVLLRFERNRMSATVIQANEERCLGKSSKLSTPASIVSICDFPILQIAPNPMQMALDQSPLAVSLLLADSQSRLMHTRIVLAEAKGDATKATLLIEAPAVLRSFIATPLTPSPAPIHIATSYDKLWLMASTPVYLPADLSLPTSKTAAIVHAQPYAQMRSKSGARLTAEAISSLRTALSLNAIAPSMVLSTSQTEESEELIAKSSIAACEIDTQCAVNDDYEGLSEEQKEFFESATEYARACATWEFGLTDPMQSKSRAQISWALRKENIALALLPPEDIVCENLESKPGVRSTLTSTSERFVDHVPPFALPSFSRLPPHDMILSLTFLSALNNLTNHTFRTIVSSQGAVPSPLSVVGLRACLASTLHAQQLAFAQSVMTRFLASHLHTLASPASAVALSFARAVTLSQPIHALVHPRFFTKCVSVVSHSVDKGELKTRESLDDATNLQVTLGLAKTFIRFALDAIQAATITRIKTKFLDTKETGVGFLATMLSNSAENEESQSSGDAPLVTEDMTNAANFRTFLSGSARNDLDVMRVYLNSLDKLCSLLGSYIIAIPALQNYVSENYGRDLQEDHWQDSLTKGYTWYSHVRYASLNLLRSLKLVGTGTRLTSGSPAAALHFLLSRLRHLQNPPSLNTKVLSPEEVLNISPISSTSDEGVKNQMLDFLPLPDRIITLANAFERILQDKVTLSLLTQSLRSGSPLRGEINFSLFAAFYQQKSMRNAKKVLKLLEQSNSSTQSHSLRIPKVEGIDTELSDEEYIDKCRERARDLVNSFSSLLENWSDSKMATQDESKTPMTLPKVPPYPSVSIYIGLLSHLKGDAKKKFLEAEVSTLLIEGSKQDSPSRATQVALEKEYYRKKEREDDILSETSIDCQLFACESCSWISPRFVATVCPHCLANLIAL